MKIRSMAKRRHKISSKIRRKELLFELLIFGVLVGVTEDLIAVKVVTGEPITWEVVGIVILIAIPFAIFGEVIVDRIDFVSFYRKIFK